MLCRNLRPLSPEHHLTPAISHFVAERKTEGMRFFERFQNCRSFLQNTYNLKIFVPRWKRGTEIWGIAAAMPYRAPLVMRSACR
jgi:hypothetical protein